MDSCCIFAWNSAKITKSLGFVARPKTCGIGNKAQPWRPALNFTASSDSGGERAGFSYSFFFKLNQSTMKVDNAHLVKESPGDPFSTE